MRYISESTSATDVLPMSEETRPLSTAPCWRDCPDDCVDERCNGGYGSLPVTCTPSAHSDGSNGRMGSTASLSTMTGGLLRSSSFSSDSGPDSLSSTTNRVVIEGRDRVRNFSIEVGGGSTSGSSNSASSNSASSSSGDDSCDTTGENCDGSAAGRGQHEGLSRLKAIRQAVLTPPNLRVLLSFAIWYITYMIMGILGGTVAYMHFPRTDLPYPDPLPDYGYDVIPYWCPAIPHAPHGNIQSVVLLVLYTMILSGVTMRWTTWTVWRPWRPWKVGKEWASWGGDGRLIFQRLLHLNSLVFLTRTSTVCLTGLPQPNPKCTDVQFYPVTYPNAFHFVMGRGFPPDACGDLIYSGHVGCTLVCMIVLNKHGYLRNAVVRGLVWAIACLGIYCTISCRSHYTVDVVLAFYMAYFLGEWYYLRAEGTVQGRVARFIQWLEVKPVQEEQDKGKLIGGDKEEGDGTKDEIMSQRNGAHPSKKVAQRTEGLAQTILV